MTLDQFMTGIRQNISRVKEYKLGMDGTNGQCDCIGLIIGGIRLAGGTWRGTHGSNYAARNEMKSLSRITSPAQLQVGDLVYKVRSPGESGYNLPPAYASSPDQLDYYHVGVVTQVNPLRITHCTNVPGGIKVDTAVGAWQYYGLYKGIEATDVIPQSAQYRVVGGSLRMRQGPGTNYAVILSIPNGTQVQGQAVSGNDEWLYVSYNGSSGYSMAQYLQRVDNNNQQALQRLMDLLTECMQIVESLQSAG